MNLNLTAIGTFLLSEIDLMQKKTEEEKEPMAAGVVAASADSVGKKNKKKKTARVRSSTKTPPAMRARDSIPRAQRPKSLRQVLRHVSRS